VNHGKKSKSHELARALTGKCVPELKMCHRICQQFTVADLSPAQDGIIVGIVGSGIVFCFCHFAFCSNC
jgi:hypothetical protein